MIVFPNAKINLGLNILSRRSDGFHQIESVFYPIQLCDALEIVASSSKKEHKCSLQTFGIPIPGEPGFNLCTQAYALLDAEFSLPPVNMYLVKKIPTGSGLGGGSSDAAFAIGALNSIFRLGLSIDQQKNFAGKLGSDCPFFIQNKPAFVSGRGEVVDECLLDLSSYRIEVKFSGVPVETRWAYSMAEPAVPETGIHEIIRLPVKEWKGKLVNDFEKIIFKKYPEVEKLKESFYSEGAVYASMSGSGSAVYGIFEK